MSGGRILGVVVAAIVLVGAGVAAGVWAAGSHGGQAVSDRCSTAKADVRRAMGETPEDPSSDSWFDQQGVPDSVGEPPADVDLALRIVLNEADCFSPAAVARAERRLACLEEAGSGAWYACAY